MYRSYTSPRMEPRPSTDVESSIRDLTKDLVMAFNTGNFDQAAALFAADGVMKAPHHESVFGPKAVEQAFRQLSEAGYDDLRVEATRVEVSGEMAMEMGRYQITVRQQNGTVVADRGSYVKVWRRLGVWRIVADFWSTQLPAAKQE
jgi:uncharacterized protein (TIGR02246 family)